MFQEHVLQFMDEFDPGVTVSDIGCHHSMVVRAARLVGYCSEEVLWNAFSRSCLLFSFPISDKCG